MVADVSRDQRAAEEDALQWIAAIKKVEGVKVQDGKHDEATDAGHGYKDASGEATLDFQEQENGTWVPPRKDVQPPPRQKYPHESEYGGGANYSAAPYDGGVSITKIDVLMDEEKGSILDGDSQWRCWPSGPLPPNQKILGTDQNMLTVAPKPLTSHEVDSALRSDEGCVGVGLVLHQAYQGIEISEGKFSVQIKDVVYGSPAHEVSCIPLLTAPESP